MPGKNQGTERSPWTPIVARKSLSTKIAMTQTPDLLALIEDLLDAVRRKDMITVQVRVGEDLRQASRIRPAACSTTVSIGACRSVSTPSTPAPSWPRPSRPDRVADSRRSRQGLHGQRRPPFRRRAKRARGGHAARRRLFRDHRLHGAGCS